MKIENLIKQIETKAKATKEEAQSAEGLAKLQEVAAHYSGEDELVWSHDLVKELKDQPKKKMHPTNISLLDEVLGGFKEEQLITVSGSSGHGKSAFGMFLIEQMRDTNPVMIPIEQSNEELIEQRQENGYSVPEFLSPRKLAGRVTVDWIEERIIEGIAKYNTKMVVIDHLGYIDDFGDSQQYKKENLAYRIEMIMKGLKSVAKRWGIVIVLLVHISQADEGNPPSTKDLKNSSAILQESDTVMLLWRKNYIENKVRIYQNETMVSVQKNRRTGKNKNIGLKFDSDTGRYQENNSWVESMEATAQAEKEFDDF